MSASRPKSPGLAYAAMTLVLLVTLAAISITAAQSPPPAIAELAPQAAQQIKDAPSEQASSSGEGPGGEASGEASATTTTTAAAAAGAVATTSTVPAVRQPRLRRCFGDPPRQTEDPQSPPCVPFFEGDNGGATTRGVTADEIRIAVPRSTDQRALTAIQTYLNTRYELYGRSINLIRAGGFGAACTDQRAKAVSIDAMQVFGATDAGTANSSCLYDELTRRKIVTSEVSYAFTEAQARARDPYLWEYLMGDDQMFAVTGEMVCARLAGKKASHSGTMQQAERRFGVILQTANRDDVLPTKPLDDALARCSVKPAATVTYDYSEDQGTRGRDAVLRMQEAGVTSIICLCVIVVEASLAPAATGQGYFPEWIYNSYGSNDYDVLFKASVADPQQRAASMAITVQPPQRPLSQEYGWLAYKETDPGLQASYLDTINLVTLYRSLLVLVSGIQLAGPALTPTSFARGLQATPFPNPADPGNSGAVGFLGPDHGMTNDAAEMWWSESARGADGSSGGWCYVERGARRRPGAWPKDGDPFFGGPCFSAAG